MAEKKSFILRIDTSTFQALERWAGDDFRSVNGQLEWLIDKALKEVGRKKETADDSKQITKASSIKKVR